ncbi:auxilin-like clathrin-binding protein required for normal clathrin function [Polyrhizophydium stewartii]|uniref:Auxilin-like clathrin-binding protein required for normal clathrin function n=1 Tax=Polyrhizophydium stewartii TaxID=2732419 RepID=A0ABR4NGQ1_9FUNG
MSASVQRAVDTAMQKMRDQAQQAEREEAQKLELKDSVDDKIQQWRRGKEDNLRALLSSLDAVLWPELAWKTINLSELITPQQVKVRYMRAVGKVHPDKLSREATVEQKLIANSVFATLNKAWDSFRAQNGLNMSALDHGSAAGAAHGGETIHGHEEWDTNVDYDWDEADDAANALDPSALAGAPAEYGDDLYAGDGDLPGDDGGGVFLHHLGGDGNGAADGSEAHAGAQPLQHPHPHNDRLSNPPSPDVRDLELAQSHRSDAPHAAAGVWGLPARPSTAPYTITQRQPAGQAAAGGVASHARTHDNSDALVLTGGIASAPPGGRFAGSPPPPYSGGRYGGEANGGGGTGSRFQSPRQPYAPRTGYGQQLSFGHQAHQNYQHQQAADTCVVPACLPRRSSAHSSAC